MRSYRARIPGGDSEQVYINLLSKLNTSASIDGHQRSEAGYFQFDDTS